MTQVQARKLVPLREFRQETDRLLRQCNVHYHACVGSHELENWARVTVRIVNEVSPLDCSRAKPEDRDWHRKALEAAADTLERALVRIKELQQQEEQDAQDAELFTIGNPRPVLRLVVNKP
ncbi:hypothetical protein FUT48_00270 [Pseudomonas sp. JG-B]|nr:hypothetical protein [Pseudomonas sp. JG-B]